tara:strand:- start:9 stop:659 length:651 start_codon:yes stop_codon:yes gene_type:complete
MNFKTINSDSVHTKTVIILHGMNQDVNDMLYIINKIKSKKNGKFIKFIIPIAEKMNIIWPDGKKEKCSSWYNYFTRYDNLIKHDIINSIEFQKNTEEIIDLINQESKIVHPEFISLIGLSQGGTICINVALNLKYKIENIICIDTIFLHTYYKYTPFKLQCFKVLISNKDEIYNPMFQKYCYSLLKSYKNEVDIFTRDNYHCENSDSIAKFIAKFI